MKKEKTWLTIECAWHVQNFGRPLIMGRKDGKGQTGTTHSICKACQKIEWGKFPGGRPSARWNLIGRFLEWNRRRTSDRRTAIQRAALAEKFDREADERRNLEDMFATNPALHARVMLTGRRLIHYLEPEDLSDLQERVKDQPEMKCRWN